MSDISTFEPLWGAWRIEQLICESDCGKVYRAVCVQHGMRSYCAIKHIGIPFNENKMSVASGSLSQDVEFVRSDCDRLVREIIYAVEQEKEFKHNSHIATCEDFTVIPRQDSIGFDVFIRTELRKNLTDLLSRSRLTDTDVVRMGIDICSALEECHRRRVVHGNIKPTNIFIGDSGEFMLGDFVSVYGEENFASGRIGKGYSYMAPEVYHGERPDITSDIYSLGLVLYTLLNGGRLPFLSAEKKRINAGETENAVLRRMFGEPLPVPAYGNKDLADVIMKAVQYDRKKRFSSSSEFKTALCRLLPRASTMNTIYEDNYSIESIIREERDPYSTSGKTRGGRRSTKEQNVLTFVPDAVRTEGRDEDTGGKKPTKTIMVLFIAVAVIVSLTLVFTCTDIGKAIRYNYAKNAFENGKYEQAYDGFSTLSTYADSAKMAEKSRYFCGKSLYEEGRYDEAEELLLAVSGETSDSDTKRQCEYICGHIYLEQDLLNKAKRTFKALGKFEDSKEMVKECDYRQAVEFFDGQLWYAAKEIFLRISDYKDSSLYLENCDQYIDIDGTK